MPMEWLANLVKNNFSAFILDLFALFCAWWLFSTFFLPGLAKAENVNAILAEVQDLSKTLGEYQRNNEINALESELRNIEGEIFTLRQINQDGRSGNAYTRKREVDLKSKYNETLRKLNNIYGVPRQSGIGGSDG